MGKYFSFFMAGKTGLPKRKYFWNILRRLNSNSPIKAQAFLELAIILPILFILVIGVVEVSFIMGRYLDMLQLTREAARFASGRDPLQVGTYNCSDPNIDFYYHTTCIFSPPAGTTCLDSNFCNGMNPYMNFDPAKDDVVISVYKITSHLVAYNHYWEYSDTAENWKEDCQGNHTNTSPHFTASLVESMLESSAPPDGGFVAVEYYSCYNLPLSIPIFTNFVPESLRLHAYTIMPLPKAKFLPDN